MNEALTDRLAIALRGPGFAFTGGTEARRNLSPAALAAWPELAASWNALGDDLYMADGGRYRRRRHATLRSRHGMFVPLPHQPHFQSRDYNPLNGGVARWFAPVEEQTLANPALRSVLALCDRVFSSLSPSVAAWLVELHQFRIEAKANEAGQPTPEGLHRDGVDWVMVLLVARQNVRSGETAIHDEARHKVGSFTLTEPLDAAWLDDTRMYHGVTAIEPIDPARPAYRDVLVVTFKAEG